MSKPYVTVKASEWKRMPKKTKLALAEMCRLLLKHSGEIAKAKHKEAR